MPLRLAQRSDAHGLPARALPFDRERWLEHVTEDGRLILVDRDVLEVVHEQEAGAHPNETGGLLFGRTFDHGAGTHVLVTGAVTPQPGEIDANPSRVTISTEGAFRMGRRAAEMAPTADICGWWHTHPLYPAYFSSVDRDEQSRWREPFSVGLVLSGLGDASPGHRIFVGPGSDEAVASSRAVAQRFRSVEWFGAPEEPVVDPVEPESATVGPLAAVLPSGSIRQQFVDEARPHPVLRAPSVSPGSHAARPHRRIALAASMAAILLVAFWLFTLAFGSRPSTESIQSVQPGEPGYSGNPAAAPATDIPDLDHPVVRPGSGFRPVEGWTDGTEGVGRGR